MHGSVKSRRTILTLIALVAMTSGAAPASTHASSLLGGYGGPGQGSQVIIGSALLNGPGSGGGNGGSAGPTDSSARGQGNGSVTTAPGSTASTSFAARGPVPGAGGEGKTAGRRGKNASGELRAVFAGSSQQVRPDSRTLGLSGEELLYILLALGAVACAAVFTRRLARITQRERVGS